MSHTAAGRAGLFIQACLASKAWLLDTQPPLGTRRTGLEDSGLGPHGKSSMETLLSAYLNSSELIKKQELAFCSGRK